jgi:hypothetical protein
MRKPPPFVDKYRLHRWLDVEGFVALFGIQARVAPRKWAHVYRGERPVLYRCEAAARAAIAKLTDRLSK